MSRKIVLMGYSINFFNKYKHVLNFAIGFTGATKREMRSGNKSLDFFNISEFSKIHASEGYMLIACIAAKDWDKNKKLYEEQGFEEGVTWISREFAEVLLDNKEVFFSTGVCTVQRLKDVLMNIPEFASKYYPIEMQVNYTKPIDGTVKLFNHLKDLAGLYVYTNLGGGMEYLNHPILS